MISWLSWISWFRACPLRRRGHFAFRVSGENERLRLQKSGERVEVQAELAQAAAIDGHLQILRLELLDQAVLQGIELLVEQSHDVVVVVPLVPSTRVGLAGHSVVGGDRDHISVTAHFGVERSGDTRE